MKYGLPYQGSKKKKALMSPHSNSKDKIENIFIHKRFLTL